MKAGKKRTEEKTARILEKLDELYGTEKEGFYHNQDWQLLVAIMLSAQSTDKQVDEALPALFERFQTAQEVAEAPVEEIERYIRSVGLYKNKAKNIKKCCEQICQEYGGKVPDKLEEVLKLAGVGRKTGTLFLADAYGIPGVTVDTHVFRVSNRIGLANATTVEETEKQLQKAIRKDLWSLSHHLLIFHGRRCCSARGPKCEECGISQDCRQRQDEMTGRGEER